MPLPQLLLNFAILIPCSGKLRNSSAYNKHSEGKEASVRLSRGKLLSSQGGLEKLTMRQLIHGGKALG